jgi:hypothetical protein
VIVAALWLRLDAWTLLIVGAVLSGGGAFEVNSTSTQ